MTGSTNVSNTFVQAKVSMQIDSKVEVLDASGGKDFMNFFSQSMSVSTEQFSATKSNFSLDNVAAPVKIDANNTKPVVKEAKAKEEISGEEVAEINDKVSEYAEDVKDVIAKELDCDEEDVEKAMEVLGLTAIDLFDVRNIAQIVMQITGQEDNFGLLLDDSFTNIVDQISQLLGDLLDELDMPLVEVVDVMSQLDTEELSQFTVTVDSSDAEVDMDADSAKLQDAEVMNQEVVAKQTDDEEEIDITVNDGQLTDVKTVEVKLESNNQGFKNSDFGRRNLEQEASPSVMNITEEPSFVFDNKLTNITMPDGQVVDVQSIIDQIVEQTKVTANEATTTIEMLLNPEGLGKVYMEISQKGNEVTAKLYTENEVVKEALENQMINLKEAMNDSSTKVTSIEVSVGAHEFEKNLEENEHQKEQQEQQNQEPAKRRTSIDLNNLDGLAGLMTEEEQLVARIMKDNGNTVNYTA